MKTPTKAIDTQGLRRALTTLSFAGALAGWAVLARPEVPAMATATTPEVAEVVDAPVETSVEAAPAKVLAALVNVSATDTVEPTAAPVATAKPTAAPAAPAKPAAAPAAPRVVAAPAPRRVVTAPAPRRVVAAPAPVTRTRSSRR